MKVRTIKAKRGTAEHIEVKTSKSEKLNYSQAETLKACLEPVLLPFSYEEGKRDVATFFYDTEGTIPLNTYLEVALSHAQYRALLEGVACVHETCEQLGLNAAGLLFDPTTVRIVAETGIPSFVYVPAEGLSAERSTAVDLLMHIAQEVSFVCEENWADAEALIDYLRRQSVFSVMEFRKFLETTAFGRGKTVVGEAAGSSATASEVATFDFVGTQGGSLSACEVRSHQSLAEQVACDVAASGPLVGKREEVASPYTEIPSYFTLATNATASDTQGYSELLSSPTSPTTPVVEAGESDETFPVLSRSVVPAGSSGLQPAHLALVRLSDGSRNPLSQQGEVVIGRSRHCAIVVQGNTGLSREHAAITLDNAVCSVRDLGSTNGTFVDGKRLKQGESLILTEDATLKLADELFILEAQSNKEVHHGKNR